MASNLPKLPRDDSPAEPSARRAHVHLLAMDGRWVMRRGRRTEKTFDKQFDAFMAAIPFARERGATETEELMLKMWKMVYENYNQRVD